MKKKEFIWKNRSIFVPILVVMISAIIGPIILEWYKSSHQPRVQEDHTPTKEANKTDDVILMKTISALGLSISEPRERQIIKSDIYNDMHGTYKGNFPNNYTFGVLAKDQYNFYLMYPPIEVVEAKKSWAKSNIRFDSKGLWTLYVCLADEQGSNWLRKKSKK